MLSTSNKPNYLGDTDTNMILFLKKQGIKDNKNGHLEIKATFENPYK